MVELRRALFLQLVQKLLFLRQVWHLYADYQPQQLIGIVMANQGSRAPRNFLWRVSRQRDAIGGLGQGWPRDEYGQRDDQKACPCPGTGRGIGRMAIAHILLLVIPTSSGAVVADGFVSNHRHHCRYSAVSAGSVSELGFVFERGTPLHTAVSVEFSAAFKSQYPATTTGEWLPFNRSLATAQEFALGCLVQNL